MYKKTDKLSKNFFKFGFYINFFSNSKYARIFCQFAEQTKEYLRNFLEFFQLSSNCFPILWITILQKFVCFFLYSNLIYYQTADVNLS